MLMLCASHPSEKLISSCSTVVKIAMADCVRPIKCCGTIDINDDCATTPDIARQNPKIICTKTAPATYDTHGTMKCPALRTATDVTYNVIRHVGESWLATNPPEIAPTAQPPSRNPKTRAPPPRISLTRDTSTTLADTTPAIIVACVIPSARTRDKHSALHAHQHRCVRSGELVIRNHFLHQRIHRCPVHSGSDPRHQRHGVEMPQLQLTVRGNVRSPQHHESARRIQQYAEVAPVQAVDQHAAQKRHKQPRRRD